MLFDMGFYKNMVILRRFFGDLPHLKKMRVVCMSKKTDLFDFHCLFSVFTLLSYLFPKNIEKDYFGILPQCQSGS